MGASVDFLKPEAAKRYLAYRDVVVKPPTFKADLKWEAKHIDAVLAGLPPPPPRATINHAATRHLFIFFMENHQLQGRLLNIVLHRLSQVRLWRPLCSLRLSPSSRNRENFMKRLRALISETFMEHFYVTSRDISQMSCRETCLQQRFRLDEESLAMSSISPKMLFSL